MSLSGFFTVFVAVTWITGCATTAAIAADQHPKTADPHTTSAVDPPPNTVRCANVLAPVTVTIDGAKTRQTMDGWSTQERLWDDPHLTDRPKPPRPGEFVRSAVDIPASAQNEILHKMYRELKLTQVNPVMDRESQRCRTCPVDLRWKFADGHIAWVKQAYVTDWSAGRYSLGLSKPG